ncbi:MAG: hypothetical protein HY903_01850 [Deltaproteobacteria bacterium]|nr:hypothetical protein [Deltaproteobacteria bacterium]
MPEVQTGDPRRLGLTGAMATISDPRSTPSTSGRPGTDRGLVTLLFGLGAFSLVTQSILARELLHLALGSELIVGSFFGAWLLWIGLGALLGTRLAPNLRAPHLHLWGFVVAFAFAPLVEVVLVRHGRQLFAVPMGLMVSWSESLVVTFSALAPFCLMIGITFPIACRCLCDQSSRGIGTLYAAEAAGAMAGGLVYALFIAGRFGHLQTLVAGGAGIVLLASVVGPRLAASAAGAGRRDRLFRAAGVGLGILAALGVAFAGRWDERSRRAEVKAAVPATEIVAVWDTRYGQMALTRLEDQFTLYSDGVLTASFPDAYRTPAVVFHLLAQKPAPRRVLLVGASVTGLAQALSRALAAPEPQVPPELVVVHPDRTLAPTIAKYLPPADAALLGGAVQIVARDPRQLVRESPGSFDLIFLDLTDPTTVASNRLFTVEFFASARRALSPQGVFAFKLSSAEAYVGADTAKLGASIRSALDRAFPRVVIAAGDDDYYFAGDADAELTADRAVIAARLEKMPGAKRFADAILLDYEPARRERRERALRRSGAGGINTDDRPVSYTYATVLWERQSAANPASRSVLVLGLALTRALGPWPLVALLVLGIGGWALAGRRQRASPRADAAITVLVAGAGAMGQNLVLLLRYQSVSGAIYERLALMSGLFMLGTAVGSRLMSGVAAGVEVPARLLRGIGLATTAVALAMIPLLPLLQTAAPVVMQLGFGALFGVAGLTLGVSFPAVAAVLLAPAPGGAASAAGSAGGLVDAFDHLGAMLGAVVTGTVLLPAIGATATLGIIAGGSAAVAALWSLRARESAPALDPGSR